MRRKSMLVFAAVMLSHAGLLAAQQPTTPRAGPGPIARVFRASLRGIALTDAEKSGITSVRQEYAPKFQALARGNQPIRQQLKAAREAKDTATAHALFKQLRQNRRAGVALLRQSLVEVRTKLAPEHQPQFDKNIVRVRRMIRGRFGPG